MSAHRLRPAAFSLFTILLSPFAYVPANAGTLWVSPSPQGSLGESRFEFELPPDMRGLVSAKVLLVSGYPASISFEARLAGETLKIDGRATLRENSIRELDVSALLLERSAYETVSLVFQANGDTPQVLALRLEYREDDETAPQKATTNALVLDDLKFQVGGDVLITGDLQVDGQIDPATDTILVECSGSGLVACPCPVSHPFLMGGACERGACGVFNGFGPSTSITGTPPDTYSCQSIGAPCAVEVDLVCST